MKKYSYSCLAVFLSLFFSTNSFSQPTPTTKAEAIPLGCSSTRYSIVNLGYLDNVNPYSNGSKLNNLGNAVGTSNVQPYSGHAFYYTNNGGMQDIHPNNTDIYYSNAKSINDRNHIVGAGAVANSAGSSNAVFYYDQQTVQIIARSESPEFIDPVSINAKNQILLNRSNYSQAVPVFNSYVWQNGQSILTFDANGRPFYSKAMNNNRVVVGEVYSPAYIAKGFVWQNGQLRVLGALENNDNIRAGANNLNNNSNLIVGYSEKTLLPLSTLRRPVYWVKNNTGEYVIRDILNNSSTNEGVAYAVNNQQMIVGEMSVQHGSDRHAFLHKISTNELIDLRTVVDNLGSRVLEVAQDINDQCQILVNGRDAQGHYEAFRLDPINN